MWQNLRLVKLKVRASSKILLEKNLNPTFSLVNNIFIVQLKNYYYFFSIQIDDYNN